MASSLRSPIVPGVTSLGDVLAQASQTAATNNAQILSATRGLTAEINRQTKFNQDAVIQRRLEQFQEKQFQLKKLHEDRRYALDVRSDSRAELKAPLDRLLTQNKNILMKGDIDQMTRDDEERTWGLEQDSLAQSQIQKWADSMLTDSSDENKDFIVEQMDAMRRSGNTGRHHGRKAFNALASQLSLPEDRFIPADRERPLKPGETQVLDEDGREVSMTRNGGSLAGSGFSDNTIRLDHTTRVSDIKGSHAFDIENAMRDVKAAQKAYESSYNDPILKSKLKTATDNLLDHQRRQDTELETENTRYRDQVAARGSTLVAAQTGSGNDIESFLEQTVAFEEGAEVEKSAESVSAASPAPDAAGRATPGAVTDAAGKPTPGSYLNPAIRAGRATGKTRSGGGYLNPAIRADADAAAASSAPVDSGKAAKPKVQVVKAKVVQPEVVQTEVVQAMSEATGNMIDSLKSRGILDEGNANASDIKAIPEVAQAMDEATGIILNSLGSSGILNSDKPPVPDVVDAPIKDLDLSFAAAPKPEPAPEPAPEPTAKTKDIVPNSKIATERADGLFSLPPNAPDKMDPNSLFGIDLASFNIENLPAKVRKRIKEANFKSGIGEFAANEVRNDGDSFLVRVNGGEWEKNVRLYFVDTPESSDSQGPLNRKQADYFGIKEPQVTEVGKQAKEATSGWLSTEPFMVHDRGEKVMNSERTHALIHFFNAEEGEQWLAERLVKRGLASVTAKSSVLPDGTTGNEFQKKLKKFEKEAKLNKVGAWGL